MHRKMIYPLVLAFAAIFGTETLDVRAEGDTPHKGMMGAKTFFQTNSRYDPRIALAVDAVVVHQHGAAADALAASLGTWSERGFPVGRMFFADSDATNVYWKGRWDGTPHEDEVERDAAGNVVMCAGIRPYMLPTEGWTRHLQEMAEISIDAGAHAVLPEEPLGHVHTGYEGAFRPLWEKRYGRPWVPENSSPAARFLTCQLKNELYINLETALAATTKTKAAQVEREVSFIYPVHSMYSNVPSHLVAPMGTSLAIPGVDGYVGQVWTGPVNWALANYPSADKSVFASAWCLYDYFVAMTRGTDRKLWLLVDPVEDDPNHTWAEFETWYRHCLAAQLMFPTVDAYEVMPWPDRIFLPGHSTGGSTPAPERFRILTLSAVQMQQEMPLGGQWVVAEGQQAPPEGIGVLLADNVLWHRHEFPTLRSIYSLVMALVMDGVPPAACLMERLSEPGYLDRFNVLVLSYEFMKPMSPAVHETLARWVRQGGSLVVLGSGAGIDDESLWWTQQGLKDPTTDLLARLELPAEGDFDREVGRGCVLRRTTSPAAFAEGDNARTKYLPLLDDALRRAGQSGGLHGSGVFCLERGPFIIAHASRKSLTVDRPVVDMFDPEFPLLDRLRLEPGQSGLFRDVALTVADKDVPCVLHATHRLISQSHEGSTTRFVVRGPAETPAVVRVYTAGKKPVGIEVKDAAGKELKMDWRADALPDGRWPSLLIRFPNDPAGATAVVTWQ